MQDKYEKQWILKYKPDTDEKLASELSLGLGICLPTAKLLINRGYTSLESAKRFFDKKEELLHDPFLMADMDKAVERIIQAVKNNEKTVIYGDYDVDGVTSVSILKLYLSEAGMNNVSYYIPSRTGEGYGISINAVEKLKNDGNSLIITVDTGVTAIKEARAIADFGVDLVITDHHECQDELPAATAVVNPHRKDCTYPFKELAGVGVVFKLLCALESRLKPDISISDCVRGVSSRFLDLVALGTIADVMPVKDENRLIVARGLEMISFQPRPAITELMNAIDSERKNTSRKITSSFIGYTLAPRINAAGRIGSASTAVELFLSDSLEKAAYIAAELCDANRKRQEEENKIIESAYEQITKEFDFSNDRVIVLSDEKWHHGVIGIVASRITEKYGCPSILISFEGGGDADKISGSDIGKGSGRSIKGMNLVKALSSCSDILIRYGGHELAAGLTITRENLPEFKRRINEYASECLCDAPAEITIEAECELGSSDITMEQASELYKFEPYGVSNPVPVFAMFSLKVESVSSVGAGKHTKFMLSKDLTGINAIFFRAAVSDLDIYDGDYVDVLFNLDINEFQNVKSVQFILKDIRLSSNQKKKEREERVLFGKVWEAMGSGNPFPAELLEFYSESVPGRSDFAAVYNLLRKELRMEHEVFSIRALENLLNSQNIYIGYVKLKFIIYIFRELNLLGADEIDFDREVYKFKYVYVKAKTDLNKSNIYRKLKAGFNFRE